VALSVGFMGPASVGKVYTFLILPVIGSKRVQVAVQPYTFEYVM